MKTLIIGGGIIGLCSAYYLQQSGHEVVIIDKSNMLNGCSYGNAGLIVPSHFVPLAAPGMLSKGIRWMFDASSPFYIRPRLNFDLVKWGWKFYQSSTPINVKQGSIVLRDLNLLSKKLYRDLSKKKGFEFAFEEKGLLILCKKKHTFQEEKSVANIANKIGIKAQILTAKETLALDPEIRNDIAGSIFYPDDAHLHPGLFMDILKKHLLENGAVFLSETEVRDFNVKKNKISSVVSTKGELKADQIVVAGGSWTAPLLRKLKIKLLLQAGKGYNITINTPTPNIRIPSILAEAKVAVTPMHNQLRFAGTLEIAGLDPSINMNRVNGILKAIPEYYSNINITPPAKESVWSGLRPCSPDGLPYIGYWPGFNNLVIATGHAMLGLSLGPATGLLVSEILNQQKPAVAIDILNPARLS